MSFRKKFSREGKKKDKRETREWIQDRKLKKKWLRFTYCVSTGGIQEGMIDCSTQSRTEDQAHTLLLRKRNRKINTFDVNI